MEHVTLTRSEWAMIAGLIDDADDTLPPGLARRVDALLRSTPASWPDEPCVLALDPSSANTVQRLIATRRDLADAERIIQTHQEGNVDAAHRIELRDNGVASVVAYLTDSTNLHRELERHASRLRACSTTGHLALVEQATLEVLAIAPLLPGDDADKA